MGKSLVLWVVSTSFHFILFFPFLNFLSKGWSCKRKPLKESRKRKGVPNEHFFHQVNRPLPSSKNPHFQNEARFTTFLVKMSFILFQIQPYLSVYF